MSQRILLVDDDPALLQALPRTISLRIPLIQVQTASNAPTALILLQEQEYDVLISDMNMPNMNGLTLLDKVVALYPATPVLLISGNGDQVTIMQALLHGAYDYILKPIDRDLFVASLQRALQLRQEI